MPRKPRKSPGKRSKAQREGKAGPTSLRAFAKIAGLSQPAITKAIQGGRLSGEALGHDAAGVPHILDVDEALRQLRDGVESLAEAQRRVALQREIKLDLENRVKQGQLVDAERCRREFFEAGRMFREAMLGIPDRYASQVAAEGDRAKVHAMLDDAIRAALETLADRYEGEAAVAQ